MGLKGMDEKAYSRDILVCHFVEVALKPMGFNDLTFQKLPNGKVDIIDRKRGDPELYFKSIGEDWEPKRERIFNGIKEFLAKPQNEIQAYMINHGGEIASVVERFRFEPRMFVPGPLGHHLG